MTLAKLVAEERAAIEKRRVESERARLAQVVREAEGAVSAVLKREDGQLVPLAAAGLERVTPDDSREHVWSDGTTALIARRQGQVWAVHVAVQRGGRWSTVGAQVHSLLQIGERLAQEQGGPR